MNTPIMVRSARPLTALCLPTIAPSSDDSQVLVCPACAQATVPVPDPQRSPSMSHCYRCGTE
jgi:hypothetical protein